jgi:lysophospholipase L1-like esterase
MQIAKQINGYHHRKNHLPLFAKRVRAALLFLPLALLLAVQPTRADEELSWVRQAHRVVMLGDSITHSGEYVDFIDAYFTMRFPDRHIEFLDLGLPSETVSGLSEEGHAGGQFPRPVLEERLDRVLGKTKPDLVIACYGMNDGIYLPFSEERFQKFKEGMLSLHRKVTAAGAKIIHATPPVFDEIKGGHPGYQNTLDRYSDWLLAQRAEGWDVVDLHGPTTRHLTEQRARDPNYFLAADGIHPGETGHWLMAKSILLYLGAEDVAGFDNPKAMLASHACDEGLLKLVGERQQMMRDAWLTDTGYKRPGLNTGLPIADAIKKAAGLDAEIHKLVAPLPGRKSAWENIDRRDFKSLPVGGNRNAEGPEPCLNSEFYAGDLWLRNYMSKSTKQLRITAPSHSVMLAEAW